MATVAASASDDERKKKTEIARQHIEEIRSGKFSIGEKSLNPLTQDLHNAVTSLSKELYTKYVHFLMELIQNAEDNEYAAGVEPALELVLTTWDITGVGASATLLVFNNEIGFSKENIESLCSIGKSTKKGRRCQGFIGEKGIGFKSVFLVSGKPHIYSNGYQIMFDEAPNRDCGIGYIVPEWVPTRPTISDLQVIYGLSNTLPATTIILPLKTEKLETVKQHLSEIHPEVLLFLYKIKRLSVRENSCFSVEDSVSAISISSETNLISTQNQEIDSRIVHLSVQEGQLDMVESTCHYYIYRQMFPVKPENVVDSRRDLPKWAISLAFPFGDRLMRGTSSVGIFAFLPTAMVTNFPFVVHADFILSSSREAIVLDNKWNLGILDHVPSAFVNSLMTCMSSTQTAELFPIVRVLEFLPVQESPLKQFNGVRESIRLKLRSKSIVPCELFSTGEMVFCEPIDVVRILPEFRKILTHMRQVGVSFKGVSSQGKYVLHNSVDDIKYDPIWKFLGVSSENDSNHWCGKCIQTCNLVSRVPTEIYVELICFLADKWKYFPDRTVSSISLLKYIAWNGQDFFCSVSQITQAPLKIHLVWEAKHHSWLNKWNVLMGCPDDIFFFPAETVTAIVRHKKESIVKNWLVSKVGLVVTNVYAYCLKLAYVLREKKDRKLVVSLAHLVYHSYLKRYLDSYHVSLVLQSMPVVDMSGNVSLCTRSLVPTSRSTWVKLFGSGIVKLELENESAAGYDYHPSNYVEMGEVYAEAANFGRNFTPEGTLLGFLIKHGKANDLPDILPEDRALGIASNHLTSHQALLLLEWIQNLRAKKYSLSKYEIPKRFIDSVRCGKWMKTYAGFSSPNCCYLYDGTESSTLIEIGKEFKVLSAIDEGYYNHRIKSFKEVLMFVGVQIGSENIYQLIVNHLKPLLSSAMSGHLGISLLSFIRYSNDNNKLDVEFLKTLQHGKWVKSDQGFVNPLGTIYLTSDVGEAIILITDLRVVDKTYYGNELQDFVNELKLLGVVVHVDDVYKLIPQHFRFPEDLSMLNADAVFLLLKCIQQLGPEALSLKEKIVCQSWMKTSFGFKCPTETLLPHRSWGQLVEVLPLPVIDEAYYGSRVRLHKAELEAIGVAVNLDQVCNMLITKVKFLLSLSGLTSDIVISLLNCMKCMSKTKAPQLTRLMSCLSGEKWLKTCDGYRSAPDAILFDSDWGTVAPFVDLPKIDDAFYGNSIFSFKNELKMLGVVVDFNEGARLVARGLELPEEPVSVTAECTFSLLSCARSLRQSSKSSDLSLHENFLNKLKGSKWLKTHVGYRTPEDSLIFDPEWNSSLEERDGPFIDQGFYGNLTSLHKDELIAIGVKADTEDVCTSLFQILTSKEETSAVMRIYRFLHKYMQSSNSQGCFASQLWIPDQEGNSGKWVSNWPCVLHDRDNLFGSFLHVLDRHYEEELLSFLSTTFGVDPFPTVFRYVDLWNSWVTCNRCLSSAELHLFWGYISENWNPFLEKTIKKGITTLPAVTISGAVQLVEREEVFIPDDLNLKKLLGEASEKPLFVWFPQNVMSSLSKLYEIYRSFGVRKISEAVQISANSELEKMGTENSLIGKPLIKIVLAFVANPVIYMPVEERHRIAKSLLDISLVGTEKSLMVSYFLDLPSSKKRLHVEMRKLVLWEKNSQKLLVHKPSWNGGSGTKSMEFITDFSRAIAEAVLPNASGFVVDLCKIIKIGFAFGFKEDDVDSLLLSENLELFPVDASFLECAFPAAKNQYLGRDLPCTPEASIHKKQRRY
ncbi:uncharacterized protein LOC131304709 [Rhododendron vialii]|uniref:uncharacterized protein LOC131304709 n=1 Tax=Rhododendron vialii TaxID=182163 RepID=UPI0026604E7D|nr:uncharacterized protein LOC131304709 [Rhododendron vialii]